MFGIFFNVKEDADMCTYNQLSNISNEIVSYYHDVYGNSLVSVILYGSYARGDYDDASDIDVVAIVKGERIRLQEQLKEVWDKSFECGLDNDVLISPTVIPFSEYEKYKDKLPYYKNISREGKVLWMI